LWSDRSNNRPSTKSTFYDASTKAEDARQAGAESLNGNGFYRFKIGDFQATVISDGYGPIPVGPIFAMNVSEAELAPVFEDQCGLTGRIAF
jgi:hypothetical protein